MSLKDWEVIRPKKWNYNKKDSEFAFRGAIAGTALVELYDEDPTLFDFRTMDEEHKVLLLLHDFRRFSKLIDISTIRKEYMTAMFIAKPHTFHKFVDFSKLSRKARGEIACKRPGAFKKYDLPTNKISSDGWNRLLRHDLSMYMPLFFANIKSFRNKTELRRMFGLVPALVPNISIDDMVKSVLTAKEWVMLITHEKFNEQYPHLVYSQTVTKWLEQEVSVEILTGEANSIPLKKALMVLKAR